MGVDSRNREYLIITHDNAFHLDDVIACFILKKIYPNSRIIRTRDKELIETGDIVVDVGGVCDPINMRFDHHQKGFEETYNNSYSIKLSSAGLVYKYMGMEFIQSLGLSFVDSSYPMLFSSMLYDMYFISVDANDNGVDIADTVRYTERSLDSVVKCFYPINLPRNGSYETCEKIRYVEFCAAMEYMGADLVRQCTRLAYMLNMYGESMRDAFTSIRDKSMFYVVIEKGFWFKELVYYYNKLYNTRVCILITIKKAASGDVYSINSIPKEGIKYSPMIPLCEEWRGLRDDELVRVSGLKDANFVHMTGFCGSASSRNTAVRMVELSIKEHLRRQV